MPHSYDYDAIVIGSGPGGEGAAMGLVKQGARRRYWALPKRWRRLHPLGHHPVESPPPRRQPHYRI